MKMGRLCGEGGRAMKKQEISHGGKKEAAHGLTYLALSKTGDLGDWAKQAKTVRPRPTRKKAVVRCYLATEL